MIGPKIFFTGMLFAVVSVLIAMTVPEKHYTKHEWAWATGGLILICGGTSALIGAVMWIWGV